MAGLVRTERGFVKRRPTGVDSSRQGLSLANLMIVNIHAAKTNLSRLIERMEAGEEVIIARAGRPVARLAPLVADAPVDTRETPNDLPSWMGSLRGRIWMAPDIDEDWAKVAERMEDGPIYPPEPPDA